MIREESTHAGREINRHTGCTDLGWISARTNQSYNSIDPSSPKFRKSASNSESLCRSPKLKIDARLEVDSFASLRFVFARSDMQRT